jgi:hypothetical protein
VSVAVSNRVDEEVEDARDVGWRSGERALVLALVGVPGLREF